MSKSVKEIKDYIGLQPAWELYNCLVPIGQVKWISVLHQSGLAREVDKHHIFKFKNFGRALDAAYEYYPEEVHQAVAGAVSTGESHVNRVISAASSSISVTDIENVGYGGTHFILSSPSYMEEYLDLNSGLVMYFKDVDVSVSVKYF